MCGTACSVGSGCSAWRSSSSGLCSSQLAASCWLSTLHIALAVPCLQALESFILRCPKDASPHCAAVLSLALRFLSHDPNYTDDAMEEDEEEGDEAEEECVPWQDPHCRAGCQSGHRPLFGGRLPRWLSSASLRLATH